MASLRDYGLASSGEKIRVEHILVLSLSSAWEEPVRRWLQVWGESSRSMLKTFQVMGCGLAAYLVLSGVSRVIDSLRQDSRPKLEK